MPVFFLMFVVFPLIELALIIQVGKEIGVLPTLLLLVCAAVLGSQVLRFSSLATALLARERMARGEIPEIAMLEGMLLTFGGVLLILPGFITDVLALFCLLPFTRRLLVGGLLVRLERQALRQRAFTDDLELRNGPPRPHKPNVIEGEFERHDQ